jgi:hypothetical protein
MDGWVDGGSTGIHVPTELDKPLISTRGKVPPSRPQLPVFFVYGEFSPLGNQSYSQPYTNFHQKHSTLQKLLTFHLSCTHLPFRGSYMKMHHDP